MARHRLILVVIITVGWFTGSLPSAARDLTWEDRVAAQEAIERVYWNHRTWPGDDPATKPDIDAVLPKTLLAEKVADAFKMSAALEKHWGRELTPAQVQAELDRMARDTNAPEVLRELFQALDNDPDLIAEALVRPILAERLLRSWYANDDRLHAATQQAAEHALANVTDLTELRSAAPSYSQVTYVTEDADPGDNADADSPWLSRVPDGEWDALVERVAREILPSSDRPLGEIPPGQIGLLRETETAFVVTALAEQREGGFSVGIAEWPKVGFESWWARERLALDSTVGRLAPGFELPEIPGSGCSEDTWRALPGPPRFEGNTAIWTGTEMIVWGGIFDSDSGGHYDPATDTWRPVAAPGPQGRRYHTAVWTGTEMIVWGGEADGLSRLNTGARYDPIRRTWLPVSLDGAPEKRRYHTAVWTGTEMIVWGGDDRGPRYNDGGRYDPATDQWQPTSLVDAPSPRYRHTAVWTGNEMIVWGGWAYSIPLATGARYDPATDQWTPTSMTNAPSPRFRHTAVWTGNEMIVWGAGVATGGRYDPIADTWVALSEAGAPSPRADYTAVWTGTEMIIWGGDDNDELDTGARYSPAHDAWKPTTTTNAPLPRRLHRAVWTGSEMIVWGGVQFLNGALESGGRYDPATDSWVATSVGDAPTPRSQPGGVWTGSEMIVWGGLENRPYNRETNTGGIYYPATDSWKPTVQTGAAGARFAHHMVWTGQQMLVYGGLRSNEWLDDGALYEPVLGTWAPISSENAPVGSFASVWTGEELILWGSYSGLPLGAVYNLASDAWRPVSNAGAPSRRESHTAVWTGEEMIVWGGYLPAPAQDGGRYDPETDSWSPVSVVGAPDPRARHHAIWTGTKMLVWGGQDLPDFFDTGGAYDPGSDTWVAMSTLEAPSGRSYGRAVWTGDEMIVVSGSPFPVRTGGRYEPAYDTWAPTSTIGAPPDRLSPAAVWTGRQLILWGGYSSRDGGVYCGCPKGDFRIRDVDGDGIGAGPVTPVCNVSVEPVADVGGDNCPLVANPNQRDIDGDSVGDACDSCPNIANAGQEQIVACIEVAEDGGPCLETAIELIDPVADGRLVVNAVLSTPTKIVVETLATTCSGAGDPLTISLNATPLITVPLDPEVSCTCTEDIQAFEIDDPALLAHLDLYGSNVIAVEKEGTGTFVSWARVRLETESGSEEVCVFPDASGCNIVNLCDYYTGTPFSGEALFPDPFLVEVVAAVFQGGSLPDLVDLTGLDAGNALVCVEAAGDADCVGFSRQNEEVMAINGAACPPSVSEPATD